VRAPRSVSILAVAAALALVAAACGGGGGGESGGGGEGGTIRFVFSPDPVWDWLVDEGILAEMQDEAGITIDQSESDDEFAVFAGGHADVVSTGSYETPILESENEVETVTIGSYNMAKDVVVVAGDKQWETFGDLPSGCKVGVESFSGSTTVWQALANDMDGRTLAEDAGDLQMAIADFELGPELVLEGDLCAAVTSHYAAIPYFMEERVKVLYDGKSASQLYAEHYEPGHEGMNSNNFITLRSWYEDHPEEVAFFLEVWQRGLDEWENNRDAIMEAYPQHFGHQNEEQLEYLMDYNDNVFDEFVDTVYLTEEWIEGEVQIVELLRDAGLISEDQPQPTHVCIDPGSGEETCRLPEG